MISIVKKLQTGKNDHIEITFENLAIRQGKLRETYEVLQGGKYIPYYDFDQYLDEVSDDQDDYDWLLSQFTAVQDKFPNGKIMVFFNKREDKKRFKRSSHILVRDAGYYDSMLNIPVIDHPDFDKSVYCKEGKRQLFRLPYARKNGKKDAVLERCALSDDLLMIMPCRYEDIEEVFGESISDYCITNVPDGYKLIDATPVETKEEPIETESKKDKPKKVVTERKFNQNYTRDAGMVMMIAKNMTKQDFTYQEWFKICQACGYIAEESNIDLLESCQSICSLNANYDEKTTERTYNSHKDIENPVQFGTIRDICLEHDPSLISIFKKRQVCRLPKLFKEDKRKHDWTSENTIPVECIETIIEFIDTPKYINWEYMLVSIAKCYYCGYLECDTEELFSVIDDNTRDDMKELIEESVNTDLIDWIRKCFNRLVTKSDGGVYSNPVVDLMKMANDDFLQLDKLRICVTYKIPVDVSECDSLDLSDWKRDYDSKDYFEHYKMFSRRKMPVLNVDKLIQFFMNNTARILQGSKNVVAVRNFNNDNTLCWRMKPLKNDGVTYSPIMGGKMRSGVKIAMTILDEKGKEQVCTMDDFYEIFLWHSLDYADIDFTPYLTTDPTRQNVLNTFSGFPFQYQSDMKIDMKSFEIIIEHLKDVICDGHDESYDYILKWIYGLFTNWHRKGANTAIILQSDMQGTGKGSLLVLLRRCLGDTNVKQVQSMDKIVGKFNADMAGKLLIAGDDVTDYLKPAKMGILKGKITENTINIEPKGIDPYTIPDCARYIFTSNSKVPIALSDANDRRFVCFRLSEDKVTNRNYWEQLYATLNDDNSINMFYNWIITIGKSNNWDDWRPNKHIPKTEMRAEIIEDSLDSIHQYMIHFANENDLSENEEAEYDVGIQPVVGFYKSFVEFCSENKLNKGTTNNTKKKIIKISGVEPKQVRYDGSNRKCYIIRKDNIRTYMTNKLGKPYMFDNE